MQVYTRKLWCLCDLPALVVSIMRAPAYRLMNALSGAGLRRETIEDNAKHSLRHGVNKIALMMNMITPGKV